MHVRHYHAGLGILLLNSVATAAGPTPEQTAFFEAKIRPVLVEHCYSCHSKAGKKQRAGLAVDTREGVLAGGESGLVIVPGNPAESLLVRSLRHADDAPEMPPNKRLPANIIADFEKWIMMGAPDPRDGTSTAVKKGMSIEEGRKFWSFLPPKVPLLPSVQQSTWPAGAIDRFVLAALESNGLHPSPDADPAVLIRRVTFDLIGLPPTPDEVAAFTADRSPDAYEKLVDRLLASPHFGERWGRHWLDSARYADSNGKDRNVFWYHASRYRDYVIAAFNADKPYDRFLREQVAGDLLSGAGDTERTATGFLTLGPKAFEERNAEIFRMDLIDEQIEVIGRTVLGLSIGCARCHDHKFDPIPTADYYALAGIFRSTQPLYGYGPFGIPVSAETNTELQAVGPEADKLGPPGLAYFARLQELTVARNKARSDRYRVVRRAADAKNQLAKPGADKDKLTDDIARMETEIKEWDAKIAGADKVLTEAQDHPPVMPGWTMAVRERSKPEDCKIHVRGETTNLGNTVRRGVLRVLPNPAEPVPASASGRLQLAEWLSSPDNPLTARVYVNRVWAHLFGRGLVSTPDDFGVNGARPTHPGLLDHLAVGFVQDGWSTKKVVREIVLSRAYRQASSPHPKGLEVDPDNLFLWRMSPRRLEAEAFRDAILAVSGRLDPTPPADEFLAKYDPYREYEFRTFQPLFAPADIEHRHRSVYLPVVRGVLPELFKLFDFADPERPVTKRDESTVPAQSLYLLNSPWVIDQSRHTAERLVVEVGPDDRVRMDRLYHLAFARSPTTEEQARALEYLAAPEAVRPDPKVKPDPEKLRAERWASFCQAVFASGEFRFLR